MRTKNGEHGMDSFCDGVPPMFYPERPSHFAHRFCRQLSKRGAAQDVGADGCWLLTVIAMQEDVNRYIKPPRYYNEALADRCGFTVSKLLRVRERCVDAGYLHYSQGNKAKRAIYWVVLPDVESPDDEPTQGFLIQNANQSGIHPESIRNANEMNPESIRNPSETHPEAYIPIPKPSPTPKKRDVAAATAYSPDFEVAWDAYRPTYRGGKEKPESFKEWQKAVGAIRGRPGIADPCDWLLEKIRVYADTPDGRGQFSPVMHRWLKKQKFDDDIRQGGMFGEEFDGFRQFNQGVGHDETGVHQDHIATGGVL